MEKLGCVILLFVVYTSGLLYLLNRIIFGQVLIFLCFPELKNMIFIEALGTTTIHFYVAGSNFSKIFFLKSFTFHS